MVQPFPFTPPPRSPVRVALSHEWTHSTHRDTHNPHANPWPTSESEAQKFKTARPPFSPAVRLPPLPQPTACVFEEPRRVVWPRPTAAAQIDCSACRGTRHLDSRMPRAVINIFSSSWRSDLGTFPLTRGPSSSPNHRSAVSYFVCPNRADAVLLILQASRQTDGKQASKLSELWRLHHWRPSAVARWDRRHARSKTLNTF
ncbi:hypothetical protein B0T14DRAFT_10690 [Immersiella caudata]|uniref:Uncharacterized protein n=1 Tax=Immersiella caudata TaxID=314043 RepID=A0AA39XD54_9PEZI|nr:hypothetical protein B0T14DRAFT_10690 [Immersiella caudata]